MSPSGHAALKVLVAAGAALLVALTVLRAPPFATERCAGERYDLLTAPGGRSPYIRLAADGRRGNFLLDYGTTRSSLSKDAFPPSRPSGTLSVESFSLPTFARGTFDLVHYFVGRQPSGGQLGIVGTDFLSLLVADFSFRRDSGDVVLAKNSCDPRALRQRDMIPVHQAGFFSSDPRRLSDGLPNVPVLFLDIAGVRTWAQIDTGYDDAGERRAIDINEALYQKLLKAGVALKPAGQIATSTCSGSEMRNAFSAEGKIALTTETGVEIMAIENASLILKRVDRCGGIAGLAEPAAQLGATIIERLGSIVFDPKSEIIWVAKGVPPR